MKGRWFRKRIVGLLILLAVVGGGYFAYYYPRYIAEKKVIKSRIEAQKRAKKKAEEARMVAESEREAAMRAFEEAKKGQNRVEPDCIMRTNTKKAKEEAMAAKRARLAKEGEKE